MILRHYMVRNSEGLFSSGGIKPKWTLRGGKVWIQLGHLKNHLRQHVDMTKNPEFVRLKADYDAYWRQGLRSNEEYHRVTDPYYELRRQIESVWWEYLPDDWEVFIIEYEHLSDKAVPVREVCAA